MKKQLISTIVLAILLLAAHLPVNAQAWLKDAADFTIFQDNGTTAIFKMKVPAATFVDDNNEFAVCRGSDLPVHISYEVDDAPGQTLPACDKGDSVDLFSYALLLKPQAILGANYELSNISTLPFRRRFAGCPAMLVSAKYKYTPPGEQTTERGILNVYMVAVTATSQVNAYSHTVVVRITFELKDTDGKDFKGFDNELMAAMVHVGE